MTAGVAIVVRAAQRHLSECLASLSAQTRPPRAVVLICDTNGHDLVPALTARISELERAGTAISVVRKSDATAGAWAPNTGITMLLRASVDFVVLLNQDVELDPNWLASCERVMSQDSKIAVVGSKILSPNRLTVQHAGGFVEHPRMMGRHYGHPQGGSMKDFDMFREVQFVAASAMAIRADIFREVGLLNEAFAPGPYQDIELCDRVRRVGSKIVFAPDLVATYAEAVSYAQRDEMRGVVHRNRLIYALPWLSEPKFREAFANAELEYLSAGPAMNERRALALGYLLAMLGLKQAMLARLPTDVITTDLTRTLISMLVELRYEALRSVQNVSAGPHRANSHWTANPGLD